MQLKIPTTLAEVGADYLSLGYLLTPIAPGTKRPAVSRWQKYRIDARNLGAWSTHGAGILCGQGNWPAAAVDLDIDDESLVRQLMTWCEKNIGEAPSRVGRAPKSMLIYRWPKAGHKKRTSSWVTDTPGRKHRIEVLGNGQQFVANAVHPDTKRPYTWPDSLTDDNKLETPAMRLAIITDEEVDQLFEEFYRLAAERNMVVEKRGGRSRRTPPPASVGGCGEIDDIVMPPVGKSVDEIRALLDYLDPGCDYETWWRVGAALHHELGGDASGLEIWDKWSSGSAKYPGPDDLRSKWRSFKITPKSITLRWLLKVAKGTTGKLGLRSEHENTDLGLAQRFTDARGHDIMHCPETDQWYWWRENRWTAVPSERIRTELQAYVDSMMRDAVKIPDSVLREAQVKFARRCQNSSVITGVTTILRHERSLLVPASELDPDTNLFAVGNGVVDLQTGRLMRATREQRITFGSDVSFDERAECPLWEQTLHEVFLGDDEMASFFRRLIGYVMTGNPTEHKLVVMFGGGSNGKSVVLATLQKLFGAYAQAAAASTFVAPAGALSSSAGGPREDLTRLAGKRLVVVSETEDGAVLREQAIKQITGQDTVVARGMYAKHSTEFTPRFVPLMATNHKPVVKGTDDAIWRRLLLVPFRAKFSDESRDFNRLDKLLVQLPGILNWALRGVAEYRAMGLAVPLSVRQETNAYRTSQDILGEWIEDQCETGPNFVATASELWISWQGFARARGYDGHATSMAALGRRLEERGFPGDRTSLSGKRERCRRGIRLAASRVNDLSADAQ